MERVRPIGKEEEGRVQFDVLDGRRLVEAVHVARHNDGERDDLELRRAGQARRGRS